MSVMKTTAKPMEARSVFKDGSSHRVVVGRTIITQLRRWDIKITQANQPQNDP